MEKKKSPFKTISENLPFYPDMKDESENVHVPFVGSYIGSSVLGDDPDPTKQIPVYTFAKVDTGENFFIVQSYAIKKCVEAAKKEYDSLNNIIFQFVFKGKTTVNGKPFNQFTTGYCTQDEYDLAMADEIKTAKPKK